MNSATSSDFVFTYDLDGNYIGMWGTHGTGALPTAHGSFVTGWGIANDGYEIYTTEVADIYSPNVGNNRIQVFGLDGKFHRTWGTPGYGPGQFQIPYSIAVSGGIVYVGDLRFAPEGYGGQHGYADSVYPVVQMFSTSGEYIGGFGAPAQNFNQMKDYEMWAYPLGIAVWGNQVHIASGPWNILGEFCNWVQVFQSLGMDAMYVNGWGSYGLFSSRWGTSEQDGHYNFYVPYGIAIYNLEVFVADSNNHRIQVFDAQLGTYIRTIGSFGVATALDPKNGKFNKPTGIAINDGYLYVCDWSNARIQKFTTGGTFVKQWQNAPTNVFGTGQAPYNITVV
jgi:hypothetical protein